MAARELKPGMKGTATITTQTTVTPVSVTEVKNGTVMQASGASIIVRTDQGIKMFSQGELDKRGVKIVKDGQPAEISDFHEGDKLTAVIVTSKPPRVMTQQQVNATLAKAAPAGAAGTSAAGASAGAGKPASAASNQSARQTTAGAGGTPAGGIRIAGGGNRREEAAEDRQLVADALPREHSVARSRSRFDAQAPLSSVDRLLLRS